MEGRSVPRRPPKASSEQKPWFFLYGMYSHVFFYGRFHVWGHVFFLATQYLHSIFQWNPRRTIMIFPYHSHLFIFITLVLFLYHPTCKLKLTTASTTSPIGPGTSRAQTAPRNICKEGVSIPPSGPSGYKLWVLWMFWVHLFGFATTSF